MSIFERLQFAIDEKSQFSVLLGFRKGHKEVVKHRLENLVWIPECGRVSKNIHSHNWMFCFNILERLRRLS